MLDIITMGSGTIDQFIRTELPERKHFIAYPAGSKILVHDLRFEVGGGGTNTAVAFARLGLKTGYIGKVGVGGSEILGFLKREGIKFLGAVSSHEKSAISYVLDSREHERTILAYKGASDNLHYNELKLRKLKARWAYLCSMVGESFETQKKLVKHFSSNGTFIVYNPSSYLTEKGAGYLKPIISKCTVLVCNLEEAHDLVGTGSVKKVLFKLRKLGPKVVCVTDKGNGDYGYDGSRFYTLFPHTSIKVVERTGAGDAFGAGLTYGLLKFGRVDLGMQFGLAESESVIQGTGAKTNLLHAHKIFNIVKENPGKMVVERA